MIKNIKLALYKIDHFITEKTNHPGNSIQIFGAIMFVTYPTFYFLWHYQAPQSYENLGLRIIASLICIPLILKNQWPIRLKKYFPYYWYGVITYTLSFFFTYMTLENHFASIWIINDVSVLFFMIILLDIVSLLAVCSLGIVLGVFCFSLFSGTAVYYQEQLLNMEGILSATMGAMLLAILFSYNREKLTEAKIRTLSVFSSNIAQKLQTPLQVSISQLTNLKNQIVKMSTKNNDKESYDKLMLTAQAISESNHQINMFINNLVVNTNDTDIRRFTVQFVNVIEVIQASILRYNNVSREKIELDFSEHLIIEVRGNFYTYLQAFLNVLNNALEAIEGVAEGKVRVTYLEGLTRHNIQIIDNGLGVDAKKSHDIFNCFYTTKERQSGLGLFFTKKILAYYNSSIKCVNLRNPTIFQISFPKVQHGK